MKPASKKRKSTSKPKHVAGGDCAPSPCSASLVAFNINGSVLVKLTDYGRNCLRANYNRLAEAYGGKLTWKFRLPKEDSEGWSRWQMWSLMEELGPHIKMGFNPPFETEIKIEVCRQNAEMSNPHPKKT